MTRKCDKRGTILAVGIFSSPHRGARMRDKKSLSWAQKEAIVGQHRTTTMKAVEETEEKLWLSEWICNKFYICLSQYFSFPKRTCWSSYINLNLIYLFSGIESSAHPVMKNAEFFKGIEGKRRGWILHRKFIKWAILKIPLH